MSLQSGFILFLPGVPGIPLPQNQALKFLLSSNYYDFVKAIHNRAMQYVPLSPFWHTSFFLFLDLISFFTFAQFSAYFFLIQPSVHSSLKISPQLIQTYSEFYPFYFLNEISSKGFDLLKFGLLIQTRPIAQLCP